MRRQTSKTTSHIERSTRYPAIGRDDEGASRSSTGLSLLHLHSFCFFLAPFLARHTPSVRAKASASVCININIHISRGGESKDHH